MKQLIVVALVIVLVLLPAVLALQHYGSKAVFAFFADDSFYYLTIAKNSHLGGMITFDGERSTNGFHPLWQYLLIAVFGAVGPNQETQLVATFLLGCLFAVTGLAFAAVALMRATGSRWAPLWLVPGVMSALIWIDCSTGMQYTYSVWAFINGMESSLSICFGGILIFLLTPNELGSESARGAGLTRSKGSPWSARRCLTIGLVVAGCALARLDDIFLAPCVWACVAWKSAAFRVRARRIVWVAVPVVVLLAAYMAQNYLTTGMAIPVSGQLKSGFQLRRNILALVATCFPSVYNPPPYPLDKWSHCANRLAALVIPCAVAGGLLCAIFYEHRRRRTTDGLGETGGLAVHGAASSFTSFGYLTPLLVYILIKAAYNFGKVWWYFQGYWYHALPILIVNVAVIICVHAALRRMPSPVGAGLRVVLVIVWVALFVQRSAEITYRVDRYDHWSYAFWKDRAAIAAELDRRAPSAKLIDGRDGIIAYALDRPAVSCTGLVTDLEGLRAQREKRYVEDCVGRGFDLLAGPNGGYWSLPRSGWDATEVYRHEPSGVAFNRLTAKPADGGN